MPLHDKTARYWNQRVAEFLREIGLEVIEQPAVDGFLPAIRIDAGRLIVDMERAFPGDILHEAAHLAVIPSQFRKLASGALKGVNEAMNSYLGSHGEGLMRYPEDPVCRGILQAGEAESLAWQYAAALRIELPEELIFPEESLSDGADVVLMRLKSRAHYGINGLRAAGFTATSAELANGRPLWPALLYWLHP